MQHVTWAMAMWGTSWTLACGGQSAEAGSDASVDEDSIVVADVLDDIETASLEDTPQDELQADVPSADVDFGPPVPRPPFCSVSRPVQRFGAPGTCAGLGQRPAEACDFEYADTTQPSTLCDLDESRCTSPVSSCSDGWCYVPPVSFTAGVSPDLKTGDVDFSYFTGPATQKVVRKGYFVQQREVTRADFQRVMGYSHPELAQMPCVETVDGVLVPSKRECPAAFGSVHEAMDYANRVSKAWGLEECYALTGCREKEVSASDRSLTIHTCDSSVFAGTDCNGLRLPTRAEAELTARAGTLYAYPTGPLVTEEDFWWFICTLDNPSARVAWNCANAYALRDGCPTPPDGDWGIGCTSPQPGGMLLANPFGVFDTQGNLAEFTQKVFCRMDPVTRGCLDQQHPDDRDYDDYFDANDVVVATGGWYSNSPWLTCSMCRVEHGAGYGTYHLQVMGLRLVRTDLDDCDRLELPDE